MITRPERLRFYADLAAARHQCSRHDVLGRSRKPVHVSARREVMVRLHAAGWNLSTIGRWMDRHHTTVSHALGMAK